MSMSQPSQQSMVMDHERMTFAELAPFRLPDHVVTQLSALQRSPLILQLDSSIRDLMFHLILAKSRKNQSLLSTAEKNAFNTAVSAAISAGTYATTAVIHNSPHMMHGFMGYRGAMRFLPWHRAYLYQFEQLLQSYVPNVTIPYWDWAGDHSLPSWVLLPSGVMRGPDTSWTLPSHRDIAINVLTHTDFVAFESSLESYHNTVHMYVGGNKMPFPSVSPQDPMFWLHHANVDRIWSIWQAMRPGVDPPLVGADATMDPWAQTVSDVLDTYNLWYYYA